MPTELDACTDEALVAQSANTPEAFGVLMDRYSSKLSTYAARLGVARFEDREDIVQDAFLKAYEHIHAFDQDLSFSAWIYRITHNQTMTFFRKRRARPEGHLIDLDMDTIDAEDPLYSEILRSSDAGALHRALQHLPQQEYDVIVLRYLEHASYDAISHILEIPPGTVANRISRAKARIKKLMLASGFTYG